MAVLFLSKQRHNIRTHKSPCSLRTVWLFNFYFIFWTFLPRCQPCSPTSQSTQDETRRWQTGWAALADESCLPIIYSFTSAAATVFLHTRYILSPRPTYGAYSVNPAAMTSAPGRDSTGSGPKVKSVTCHYSPTVIQAGVVRLFCIGKVR